MPGRVRVGKKGRKEIPKREERNKAENELERKKG